MATALPADVLHLICEELSYRLDFATLFNCVASSRLFASSGAVNALYRIAHECFGRASTSGGASEDAPPAEARLVIQKNSILWRTLAMSALEQTLYPYCRHLRVLDLRDLGGLLSDDAFRSAQTYNHFFSEPLTKYMITVKATRSNRLVDRLKIKDTIAALGDVIIRRSPLLEGLTEPVLEAAFDLKIESWLPQLPNLRRLDIGDGRILSNEPVRSLVQSHCPNFSELRIYYHGEDPAIAAMIQGLPENTMTYFENNSDCNIGPETCAALSRHGKSLRTLKLAMDDNKLLALSKLSSCTLLTTFTINWMRPALDLYTTKKNECDEIAEWLKSCHALEEVTMKNIPFAPALLSPLLQSGQVELVSLTLAADVGIMGGDQPLYEVSAHGNFHDLLAKQKKLQELVLAANADEATLADRDRMLASLCALGSLRKLHLTRLTDDFTTADLRALSDRLEDLEDLYIGSGIGYADDNLQSLATLRNLKSLIIVGLSRFSTQGFLDFALALTEGNRGLSLQVDLADYDYALDDQAVQLISETLASAVDGTFRYGVGRDPRQPDDDSEDSD